mgnify:CR=1 FL=1|tara:strand:- start:238 stop:414 length:177 start_codon:yes stop_codon:yes gene_type:complete
MKTKLQMLYIRLENEIKKDLNSYGWYVNQKEEKKRAIKNTKELIKAEEKRIENRYENK